jgi:hypothetical protein
MRVSAHKSYQYTESVDVVKMDNIHLRAVITIEFEADDFVAAAAHQNTLETLISKLAENYPDARLTLRERRDRGPKEADVRPLRLTTGRVHRYA